MAASTGVVVGGGGNKYRKHYIPLESNPAVFTRLIHTLGVELEFYDVLSIDEPYHHLMVPHPVFALVLVFPTTEVYEKQCALEEADREDYAGSGDKEDVVYFKQTIHNACGLYAILHSVCNISGGTSRQYISELKSCTRV
jgi:ubiquitin carboxyl-terminal hydrolase L3